MVSYASSTLLSLGLVAFAAAEAEVSVNVYEGPKECEDSEKVRSGSVLKMHYTGTIDETSATGEKGSKFDSSRDRGETFDFHIGRGQVIKGWDQGIVGLCKGAKATLVIPPELGYGANGAGGAIPGGATLNFDVEVVDITGYMDADAPQPNLFEELDTNNDGKLTQDEFEAYFKSQGREMPPEVIKNEDKDGDGVVTWEEFGGPKGDAPPSVKEEL